MVFGPSPLATAPPIDFLPMPGQEPDLIRKLWVIEVVTSVNLVMNQYL
jgi:hypothetical protein